MLLGSGTATLIVIVKGTSTLNLKPKPGSPNLNTASLAETVQA